MGKSKEAIKRDVIDGLIANIQAAEILANDLGMLVTGHALNRAKNALGWEMQGDVEQAGKASRDER